MMNWLLLVRIAFTNNLDNTGGGIAYGISQMRLHPIVNLWISVLTFLSIVSATAFGVRLPYFLLPHLTKALGAVTLSGIGSIC